MNLFLLAALVPDARADSQWTGSPATQCPEFFLLRARQRPGKLLHTI